MKVTSITFPTGLVRTNIYASGFLVQTIDLGFRTNSFTYENGNVKTATDELGLTVTNSYDALNRLTNVVFPDGTSIAYLYDRLDLAGVKDRLGHWTRYVWDNVRRLIGVTNANGAVTTYTYCGCGSPYTVTHWIGGTALVDTFNHDILGRLTNAVYADGYELNYSYDYRNLLTGISDSGGLTLTLDYAQIGPKFKLSQKFMSTVGCIITASGFTSRTCRGG